MAGITSAQAASQLALWITANEMVSRGQSYTIEGRTFTRANATEILNQIKYWNTQCKKLSGRGGPKVKGVTPV